MAELLKDVIRDEDIIKTDEGLVFNPYNSFNNEIKLSDVQFILEKYGIPPRIYNFLLYKRAFIHRSYTKRPEFENLQQNIKIVERPIDCLPLSTKSNERLEFLGDGILECVTKYILYRRFPKEQEGFMTRLRTKIENGETLSELANLLEFNKYALIANNIEQGGGRDKNINIFEDCFEAFIGALYLESSFDTCKKFIISLIQEEVDISGLLYKETNFKDLLLQYYHKMKWEDPEYGLEETIGPDENGKKIFKMYVKGYTKDDDDEIIWTKIGRGSGSSKKKGEQEAAKQALLYYDVINENSDDESDEYEVIS